MFVVSNAFQQPPIFWELNGIKQVPHFMLSSQGYDHRAFWYLLAEQPAMIAMHYMTSHLLWLSWRPDFRLTLVFWVMRVTIQTERVPCRHVIHAGWLPCQYNARSFPPLHQDLLFRYCCFALGVVHSYTLTIKFKIQLQEKERVKLIFTRRILKRQLWATICPPHQQRPH